MPEMVWRFNSSRPHTLDLELGFNYWGREDLIAIKSGRICPTKLFITVDKFGLRLLQISEPLASSIIFGLESTTPNFVTLTSLQL